MAKNITIHNNIICQSNYRWIKQQLSEINIYFKGDFYYNNIHFEKNEAIVKLHELFKPILYEMDGGVRAEETEK